MQTVVVGDIPMPGALRVPHAIRAVVPLRRPIKEIMAGYGDKLRRVVRQQQVRCRVEQAFNDGDVARAESEMLRPYAIARYGTGAAQLGEGVVRKMAREHGRLDVVYSDGEVVSCHLGYETVRAGKRYWNALRFGFSAAVFFDSKRLHEINSLNIHLAMEWALKNGFDCYDIGDCIGRPDDGLLQWKRRRGGFVDASLNCRFFSVRLPQAGADELLWHSPHFALKRSGLTLHPGAQGSRTDDEVAFRYREMGYAGLAKVYLHGVLPSNLQHLDRPRRLAPRLRRSSSGRRCSSEQVNARD